MVKLVFRSGFEDKASARYPEEVSYPTIRDFVSAECRDGNSVRFLDLRGADLRGLDDVHLIGCDIRGTDLRNVGLKHFYVSECKADYSTNWPHEIPVVDVIDKKILDRIRRRTGNLAMRNWHSCGTTHCRAGWAVHFGGLAGWQLEARFGPSTAGRLIYMRSQPGKKIPNFQASNFSALVDMGLAEDEAETLMRKMVREPVPQNYRVAAIEDNQRLWHGVFPADDLPYEPSKLLHHPFDPANEFSAEIDLYEEEPVACESNPQPDIDDDAGDEAGTDSPDQTGDED